MITWFFIDSFSVVTVGILHTEDILRTRRGGATEARLGTGPLQGFFFLPFMQYSIFSFFLSKFDYIFWVLDFRFGRRRSRSRSISRSPVRPRGRFRDRSQSRSRSPRRVSRSPALPPPPPLDDKRISISARLGPKANDNSPPIKRRPLSRSTSPSGSSSRSKSRSKSPPGNHRGLVSYGDLSPDR